LLNICFLFMFYINFLGSLCSEFVYWNHWTYRQKSDRKCSTKCLTCSSYYCHSFLWIWIFCRFSILDDWLTCSMYYLFFVSCIIYIKMFDASRLWQHFRKIIIILIFLIFWDRKFRKTNAYHDDKIVIKDKLKRFLIVLSVEIRYPRGHRDRESWRCLVEIFNIRVTFSIY